ncbi:MAG TPA: LytTR family DNA-binding domain-containing protein [Candidatus Mediterraneibacter pullicola]|uniref:Stage 0 sporulation protein A homolog n=1 Tax=Candidatus Mediterraneibacter pullicola TaxID=2838682 RepID=A0A9D2KIN2_9FIRM|nr:LytTR family DNA-binding domain-containing protein [Candidatus Mediterraneibacter pullicola]
MKIGISSHNNRNRQQILSYLNYLQKTRTLFETKEYEFGADLLKDLNKGIRFDVIFLDVDFENVAKKIRELDRDVLLIFVSRLCNQVFNAFEVNAFQYLLKPINFYLFFNTLKRVFQLHHEKKRVFVVKYKQQIRQILLKNIVYIECYNRHILVQTVTDQMESYQTFRETAEKLIPLGFIRVHQSFLVNLSHIKEIGQNEIIGTNGIIIPVSIRRKKEVLEGYRMHIEKHNVWKL